MASFFALCCTSRAASTTVSRALEHQTHPFLIAIQDLNHEYTQPSEPPIAPFDPPFSNQNAKTCWQSLTRMVDSTGSDVDKEMFALIDDRSAQDGSALLVLALEDEDGGKVEIESVRVDLALISDILATWKSKGDNMPELVAAGESSGDGVVRK